ncbi:hypothetical protein [Streptomyces sp. YS-3]|uniref:hypothetical protein n=1 Tax=Streptomyces sp. YS-3 TaxID=3381352 RepID=UPI003862CBBD
MDLSHSQRTDTDEEGGAVRQLHAQGLGRNEIARRLNWGTRTVSVIAADLGPSAPRHT